MRMLLLVSVVLSAVFSGFCNAGSISFYVAAHQDDWQLFMNPNAYSDVNSSYNTKTVFIYLTAGDAGDTGRSTTTSYYVARENGANRSVRFMADVVSPGTTSTVSDITVNGNSVRKVVYKNTVSYFLRLPDGGDGNGFQSTGYQSLKKLYSGAIASITNINGSVTAPTASKTYYGWNEVVATLIKIVQIESVGFTQVFANLPDPDTAAGSDNFDHTYTGIAMRDAMAWFPCVTNVFFTENPSGFMAVNLSTEDIINEAATWGAMTTGLTDLKFNSTYDAVHKLAVGKNYARVVAGSGSCTF